MSKCIWLVMRGIGSYEFMNLVGISKSPPQNGIKKYYVMVQLQREKIDLSSVCMSLIRGEDWKWVGVGWHHLLFISKDYSIDMCKSSFF